MKSAGPWNLRGLRPEAREAAREAARRSGMSVGEWLNSVIHKDDDEADRPPSWAADYDAVDYRPQPRPEPLQEWRQQPSQEPRQPSPFDNQDRYRPRDADDDRHHPIDRRPASREGAPYREEARRDHNDRPKRERNRDRETARAREAARESARLEEDMRQADREREELRKAARAREEFAAADRARNELRKASRTREELGEVHSRLDKLSQQLERLAHADVAPRPRTAAWQGPPSPTPAEAGNERLSRLTGAPAPPRRGIAATQKSRPAAGNRPSANNSDLSIEDAVAEITARQRALDGHANVPPPLGTSPGAPLPEAPPQPLVPPQPLTPAPLAPAPPDAAGIPAVDLSGIEKHLRQITSRIEALRPSSDIEKAISSVRDDLTEIGRLLTEALPRHAVESLEIEVKALAQRIDHSRQSGIDANALAGLERGLTEVREALRGLTPAENLVGFDEAVKTLAQKVDLIIAKEDPAALQQLETAIGALRGIVSHVASNDTLTKVAEDVRSLAGKVDGLANSAASGNALSALETRIDTLASALTASAEAGHAVPRELEKLLAGLIEKLEWVQLTHTDHAALAHLEDRIAMLVKRFDASDARLGHLEAIERGLADLLVHIEQMRGINSKGEGAKQAPVIVDAITRDVAEIRQSERRTQDSLEAVQDTVEHVVDRLATIETAIRSDTAPQSTPAKQASEHVQKSPPAQTAGAHEKAPRPAAPAVAAPPAAIEPAPRRSAAARPPIDPNLPPDHPLEPGSAAGRPRASASAADRIAASEAAVGAVKPPVIPDPGGKADYIAAARRAAHAAASAPVEHKSNPDGASASRIRQPLTQTRLRKLLVAGGAVLILVGCIHIASRLFDDGGASAPQEPQAGKALPHADTVPEANSAKQPAPAPTPLALPAPPPAAPPNIAPSTPKPQKPGRQSMLHDGAEQTLAAAVAAPSGEPGAANSVPLWSADVTGSLPRRPEAAVLPAAPAAPAVSIGDKLPATIGGPALRAAALAGDPAAAYEVGMRFAAGHGVAQNNEEAAHWLDRAADKGLAPAQFRLGGLYEKGIGVKKDLARARDLYLAAAEKGNGKAMHNLAVLYAEGIDGPANYRDAARWFRSAADHGVTDSQYNLAILYARGIGVEQNYAESYKWFVLAANQGDKEAAKKRDEVVSHLDQQSLAAARSAVQTWSAQPQPDDAINVPAPGGSWDAPGLQAARSKPRPGSAKAIAPDSKSY